MSSWRGCVKGIALGNALAWDSASAADHDVAYADFRLFRNRPTCAPLSQLVGSVSPNLFRCRLLHSKGVFVSKKRRPQGKKKLPVQVEGDRGALVAIGNPWASDQTRRDAALQMSNVYLMAVSHIGIYGQELASTCETFKNFTETKIENIDTDNVTKDVMEKVFSVSLDLIKDMIPGAEGVTEIGKVVREKIKDGIFEVMGAAPSVFKGGEIDKDKLKQTMRALAQGAQNLKRKWSTSSPGGSPGTEQTIPVLQRLAGMVSTLENNLKGNAKRSVETNTQQSEFLDMFYETDTEEKAALLDYFYAIPTPADSRNAALAFYKHILNRFSKVYGWAAATRRDQAMKASGHPSRVTTLAVQFYSDGLMFWYGKN